jgi:hypothetical protein
VVNAEAGQGQQQQIFWHAIGASSVEGVDWLEQVFGGGKLSLGVPPPQEYCHLILSGEPQSIAHF